jgi:hypothetical protein
MNKLTRIVAGSLTSVVALGVFAAPAMAVPVPGLVETAVCLAVAPDRDALGTLIDADTLLLATQVTDLADAQSGMLSSGTDVGTSGLAYVQAIDGVGNLAGTLAAFTDAASQFSTDLVGWVDAYDAHSSNVAGIATNTALLNYLSALCPAAPVI